MARYVKCDRGEPKMVILEILALGELISYLHFTKYTWERFNQAGISEFLVGILLG